MGASLHDLLEAATQPVFVELASGALIYANGAGKRLLAERDDGAGVSGAAHARQRPGSVDTEDARVVALRLAGEPCRIISLPRACGVSRDPRTPARPLPPRLVRVAALLIEGLTDKEVADRSGLSLATVRTYCRELLRELGVHGRAELAWRLGTNAADRPRAAFAREAGRGGPKR